MAVRQKTKKESRSREIKADGGRAAHPGAQIEIPIITDRPEIKPGTGFDSTVEAARIIIESCNGSGKGFTIGIFGPWGSGKSSILRELEKKLRSDQEGRKKRNRGKDSPGGLVVVNFEAWRYSDSKLLMVELIRAIGAEFAKNSLFKKNPFKKGLNYATSAAAAIISPLLGSSGSQVGLNDAIVEGLVNMFNDVEAAEDQNASDLFDVFEKMAEKLADNDSRAVILIDDLDRCAPEGVGQIISTLNTFMDLNRFIFVLALDRSYLIRAITSVYSLRDEDGKPDIAAGELFLEKVVQVPLNVPNMVFNGVNADLGTFLGERTLEILERDYRFDKNIEENIEHIIAPLALRSNPRQIKRFLNSYMLNFFINREELDDGDESKPLALLYLIALRTSAPDVYQGVLDEVNKLLSSDFDNGDDIESFGDKTIGSLKLIHAFLADGEEDRETLRPYGALFRKNRLLKDFIARFAEKELPLSTVSQVMALSAVTDASQDDGTDDQINKRMADFRDVNRSINKELIGVVDRFILGLDDSGRIHRTDSLTFSKFAYLKSAEDERYLCSLTVTNKKGIRLWFDVGDEPHTKQEAKRLQDQIDSEGLTGTFAQAYYKGHWGKGHLDIHVDREPWETNGSLPDVVEQYIRERFEQIKQ